MCVHCIDLYHRTTATRAEAIMAARRMTSRENTGDVYFSTVPYGGQADGYGVAVLHLRVPAHLAELDDEFPDGEQHFRVAARYLRPEHFIGYAVTEPEG